MDPRVTAPIERASTVAATEAQGTTTKPLDSARREATAASGTRSIVLAGDDFLLVSSQSVFPDGDVP